MTRPRHLGQAQRALIMFAFAAILFVRVAVPPGWMPSAAGQWITICTGMGVQAAWIDSDGQIHNEAPGKADPADCAFATTGSLHETPEIVHVSPRSLFGLAQLSPTYVQIGRGLAAPPPPATGPPSLA